MSSLNCECGQSFTRAHGLKRHRENKVCDYHSKKLRKDPILRLSCRDEASTVKELRHCCTYVKHVLYKGLLACHEDQFPILFNQRYPFKVTVAFFPLQTCVEDVLKSNT